MNKDMEGSHLLNETNLTNIEINSAWGFWTREGELGRDQVSNGQNIQRRQKGKG